jgi:hypothetical protein
LSVTPERKQLAVLTYSDAWLFKAQAPGIQYFSGNIYRLPIIAGQCEGICFDGDALLISNEQRELFRLPLQQLEPYADRQQAGR